MESPAHESALRDALGIAGLSEISRQIDSESFRAARDALGQQLPKLLRDPAFRASAAENFELPELESVKIVAGAYESLGSFVKFGALDAAIVIDQWGDSILAAWKATEPALPIARAHSPFMWENFEYLVVLTEDFVASHPRGSYPAGMRRKDVDKSLS